MTEAVQVALIVASGPTVLALVVAGLQDRAARIRVARRDEQLEQLATHVDEVLDHAVNGSETAPGPAAGSPGAAHHLWKP